MLAYTIWMIGFGITWGLISDDKSVSGIVKLILSLTIWPFVLGALIADQLRDVPPPKE